MASNPRHDRFLAEEDAKRQARFQQSYGSVANEEMRFCKRCGYQVGTKSQCIRQGIKKCPRCGGTEATGQALVSGQQYNLNPRGVRAALNQGGPNAAPGAPGR